MVKPVRKEKPIVASNLKSYSPEYLRISGEDTSQAPSRRLTEREGEVSMPKVRSLSNTRKPRRCYTLWVGEYGRLIGVGLNPTGHEDLVGMVGVKPVLKAQSAWQRWWPDCCNKRGK